MTDQIEKWKKEFESMCEYKLNHAEPKFGDKGVYAQPWANDMLKGFIMAKQSQQVIELPYPYRGDGFRYWTENDIDLAIESAGYTYTVKDKS